jgi:hypothetical protein
MGLTRFSEMQVDYQWNTQCYIAEDKGLQFLSLFIELFNEEERPDDYRYMVK